MFIAAIRMPFAIAFLPHTAPYTGTIAPRVTLLSGEARKAMTSATAAGLTQLLKSASGIAVRLAGVSSTEGATALTQISSAAVSWAIAWVNAATAAFAFVYATMPEPSRG